MEGRAGLIGAEASEDACPSADEVAGQRGSKHVKQDRILTYGVDRFHTFPKQQGFVDHHTVAATHPPLSLVYGGRLQGFQSNVIMRIMQRRRGAISLLAGLRDGVRDPDNKYDKHTLYLHVNLYLSKSFISFLLV